MKTFSAQNDWRRFPRIIAVALLFLVAGCGDDDDDDAAQTPRSDQTVADGLWTGTIGDINVVATLGGNAFTAYGDSTADPQDARIYAIDYMIDGMSLSETGADDAVVALDLANVGVLPADTFRLELMGTGASRMLEGMIGNDAVMLAFVEGGDEPPADIMPFVGVYDDADTWTSTFGSVGGGVTSITIDAAGMLTGMTAGSGCMFSGMLEASESARGYGTESMTMTSCNVAARNGTYGAAVFLTNSDSGTDDILNFVAVRVGGSALADFRIVVADKR